MPKSFVEVHARVRPLGPDTTSYGLKEQGSSLQVPSRAANGGGNVKFEFKNVLGREATQQQCFTTTTLPLVESLLDGFNGTVLAYGQTGAGKSHTMFGPNEAATTYGAADRGLCARAIGAVFQLISRRGLRDRATVEISALECYNEQLYEMLLPPPETTGPAKWDRGTGLTPAVATARRRGGSHVLSSSNAKDASSFVFDDQSSMHPDSAPSAGVAGSAAGARGAELAVWEDADGLAHVRGLAKVPVRTEDEALEALEEAQANRTLAAHALNARSSRAHFVFTIYLTLAAAKSTPNKAASPSSTSSPNSTINRNNNGTVRSKLHLVDLAGSERAERTAARGLVLREAAFINKSLSALEQVVIALTSSGSNNTVSNVVVASSAATNPTATALHVPYRRSKLTHLLKDSLGGNCRTTLVACVWPAVEHTDQTLATLQFAHRMAQVVTTPEVNRDQWKANNGSNNSSNYMGGGALAVEVARLKKMVAALQDELVMHDAVAAGVLQSTVASVVAAARRSDDQSSSSSSGSTVNESGSNGDGTSGNTDQGGSRHSSAIPEPVSRPALQVVSSSETDSDGAVTHTVELSDSDDAALRRAVGAFVLRQASVPLLPSWQCTVRALEVMRDIAHLAAGAGDSNEDNGDSSGNSTSYDRTGAVLNDRSGGNCSTTKRKEDDGTAGMNRLVAAVAAVVGLPTPNGGEFEGSKMPTDRPAGVGFDQDYHTGINPSEWPELRPGSSPGPGTVTGTSSSGNAGDGSSNSNTSSSLTAPRPSSQNIKSGALSQRRRNQPLPTTPEPDRPASVRRSPRPSPSQPESSEVAAETPSSHQARDNDQDGWGISDDAALAAQLQREDAEAHLARMRGDGPAAASPVVADTNITTFNENPVDDVPMDGKDESHSPGGSDKVLISAEVATAMGENDGFAPLSSAKQHGHDRQTYENEAKVNTVSNLPTETSVPLAINNATLSDNNATSTPRQNLTERFNRPLSSTRLRGRPSSSGSASAAAAALEFDSGEASDNQVKGERLSTPSKGVDTELPGSKTSPHQDGRNNSNKRRSGTTASTSSNSEQLAAYLEAGGPPAREAESQVRVAREALKEAKRNATSLAAAVNQHKLRIDALQATQQQPLLPLPQPEDWTASDKDGGNSAVNELGVLSETLLGTTTTERDDDTQGAALREALKVAKKEYRRTYAALEAAKIEVAARGEYQAWATKAFAAGFEEWVQSNSKNTGYSSGF